MSVYTHMSTYSREDRRLMNGLNLFFAALALLFLAIVVTRTLLLQDALHTEFRTRAEATARRAVHQVAAQLHHHFDSLEFLKQMVLTRHASAWASHARITATCHALAQTAPALVALRITGLNGRVLCQVTPPAMLLELSPQKQRLFAHAHRALVGIRFYPPAKAFLSTLSVYVPGTAKQQPGEITGTFWLDMPLTADDIQPPQLILSTHAPGETSPVQGASRVHDVTRAVPGYPLFIRAGWTAGDVHQAFWNRARPRFLIVAGVYLFLLLAWFISRKLLDDFLRQRQYQDAAITMQQDLIRPDEPEAMYQHMVDVLVEMGATTGACVLMPKDHTLQLVAVQAKTSAWQKHLTGLWDPNNPEKFTDGPQTAQAAFRQKTPQGPVHLQSVVPSVSPMQYMMVYPVCIGEDPAPAAAVVIHAGSARHFTHSLKQLLAQLSNTLGLALMRWQNRQLLLHKHHELAQLSAEIAHQNEWFSALIEAIPDAVFLKDGQGAWQVINTSAVRLFHLQDIAWQGKTDRQLAALHPAFQAIHEACLEDDEKAWHDQKMVIVEESMQREDGVLATFETRRVPLFTKRGARFGIVILGRDITERKMAEAQLQHLALYDSLTNLPNRRLLEIQLEQAMLRTQRHPERLVVCILDLDNFKPVNDTFGHEAGDTVLVVLSQRLTAVLRKPDFVARLGGDEFVILLEGMSSSADLDPILHKIVSAMLKPIPLENNQQAQIGVSIGVAFYPGDPGTPTARQLLRAADQALYLNKAHKQDRPHPWTIFGESTPEKRTPAQEWLDAGNLEVWYQPIVDHFTRKAVGIEALARLRDTEGTLWSPAHFLPQLQDADFTHLTKMVLAQALRDLSVLDQQGYALWVSVNLDAHSVSADCIACLQALLASNPIDPARITLEILEGDDFLEKRSSITHLERIKALGIQLAIDDLGSAYASLLRLKTLPIDKVKLDQAFVRTLEDQPQDLYFVNTIQDLATSLGVTLVVEGVETADILDAMTITGVSLLQGYAIARPLPLQALQQFLQSPPVAAPSAHPQSFLGLYALHLALHSVMEKTMRQNLRLMDYKEMVDPTICPLHLAMQDLGVLAGSPLDQYHQAYHTSIAQCISHLSSSPNTLDWGAMERAQRNLEQAILDAYATSRRQ